MNLSRRTLSDLAEIICGSGGGGGSQWTWNNFPYRSSMYLTEFFRNCDLEYVHDGSTRKQWVVEVLEELNSGPSSNPQLPSDALIRVAQELLDAGEFGKEGLNRTAALADLNGALSRDGLEIYLDAIGSPHVRSSGTGSSSAGLNLLRRSWTEDELRRRKELSDFLDKSSEDEFIEEVLVPMFSQLGFRRISVSGHKDKALEYGKDVWMKYQLPTSHFLYFGVQAKKGKLDSAGRSGERNVAEVMSQVRMMLDHPIWDPETNKRNLLDHVFIACGGEITKQAKDWLGQHLDQESRRHVIFLDRDEVLDIAVGMELSAFRTRPETSDDLPF